MLAMDWLQFTSTMTGHIVSLAWPSVVLIGIWAFKEKLVEILPGSRFKKGDMEVELGKAEKVAARVPAIEDGAEEVVKAADEYDLFMRMAKLSPRGAVLELRNDLEATVIEAANMHGQYDSPAHTVGTFGDAIEYLRDREQIGSATSRLLWELQSIGNSVAHGSIVDADEALRYRQLAYKAMARLKRLPEKG